MGEMFESTRGHEVTASFFLVAEIKQDLRFYCEVKTAVSRDRDVLVEGVDALLAVFLALDHVARAYKLGIRRDGGGKSAASDIERRGRDAHGASEGLAERDADEWSAERRKTNSEQVGAMGSVRGPAPGTSGGWRGGADADAEGGDYEERASSSVSARRSCVDMESTDLVRREHW
ncbi:hypothetical protein DFH09DRAFT_1076434 [Mycena vulgaris]|nr:hypothetical protein DFH09DRAFT_1076434 [Mycena vulgaris]